MKGFRPDKRKQEEQDAGSQFNLRVNLFFSTFIIFCVIIIRLAILQFVEGPELKELETGGQVKISRFSRSGRHHRCFRYAACLLDTLPSTVFNAVKGLQFIRAREEEPSGDPKAGRGNGQGLRTVW